MKFNDCLYLAKRNILSKKKSRIAMIVMFAVIGILLFACEYINFNAHGYLNYLQEYNLATCYLYISDTDDIQKFLEQKEQIPDIIDISIEKEKNEKASSRFLIYTDVKIGEDTYQSRSDCYLDEMNTNYLNILEYHLEYSVFSKLEEKEFASKCPNEKIYLHGTAMTKAGEVVVGENLLKKYGVPEEMWESLIGKKFSLINNRNGKSLLGTYKISGIINEKVLRNSGRSGDFTYIMVASKDGFTYGVDTYCKIFPESYYTIDTLKETIEDKIGVTAEYTIAAEVYMNISKLQNSVMKVFKMVLALLIIICVSVLVLLFIYEYHCNGEYLWILHAYGITKRDRWLVLGLEHSLVLIVAMMITIVTSVFGKRWIDAYVLPEMEILASETYAIYGYALLIAVVVMVGMKGLLTLFVGRSERKGYII